MTLPLRPPHAQALLGVAALVTAAFGLTGCVPAAAPTGVGDAAPPPTESWLDDDAEQAQKAARKAWMASMHRAAEGVDPRAIERENGRREQARRLALRASGGAALGAGQWTEIGSDNLAGRVHCAAPTLDGAGLYAGSALGGLWRSDAVGGWTPLADNLFGGAHEVFVFSPQRQGAAPGLLTLTDEGLVNTSDDNGATWTPAQGLDDLVAVRGAQRLGTDGDVLVYGRRAMAQPALWVSRDRGHSFSMVWSDSAAYNGWMWAARDAAPADPAAWLVHRGALLRCPAPDYACAQVSEIDRRADSAVLAGSEAGAPTLYLALGTRGSWRLHRSDDAGRTFTRVAALPDFRDTLAASMTDPDQVLAGWVELYRSTDGGARFTKVSRWQAYYRDPEHRLHADVHGVHCWLNAAGAQRCTVGTDGGLYGTDDFGATVQNLSMKGLGVGQYYSTYSAEAAPDVVFAGAQDQGYQRGVRAPSDGPGPSTSFEQLISGDYGHLTSSDPAGALVYSTYPGFMLAAEGLEAPGLYQVEFPPDAGQWAWIPPVLADPSDPSAVFFAADGLWRYSRADTATWLPTRFGPADVPGDAGAYLSAMAFAPTDADRLYVATDLGAVFVSDDGGRTFDAAGAGGPTASYLYGQALAVHPDDADTVVLGGSGYSTSPVLKSTDAGGTWEAIDRGLPPTLVYDLVYTRGGDLYAATEAGAYRLRSGEGLWQNLMGTDAPITWYWSAEVVDGGATVRFGTYGRGIWDFAVD